MKLPGIKRILPLILTVLLLPGLLAVPVFADSYDWYQLLDYGGVNGTANTFYTMQQSDELIFFNTPGSLLATEIEILVYSIKPITGARIARNSNSSYETASVTSLGDNIYRIHLDTNRIFHSVNLKIAYDGEGSCQLQFFSVRLSVVREISDRLRVTGTLYDHSDQDRAYSIYNYPSGDYQSATWTTQSSGATGQVGTTGWDCIAYVDHNNNYESVDIAFIVYSTSVDSIKVTLGEHKVPFVVSEIVGSYQNGVTEYAFIITCDLSNISHNDLYTLDIRITGHGSPSRDNNLLVLNCWGHYGVEDLNPLAYFFASVHGWFDEQTTSISYWGQAIVDALGGSNDSSEVQDDISSAVGQLQQAGAALDSVQRPDLGQIDINVVGMVDPAGLTGVAAIASLFTGNELIYTIMVMFVTLALISYILFGK